jgi:Helix-turn-helix domain
MTAHTIRGLQLARDGAGWPGLVNLGVVLLAMHRVVVRGGTRTAEGMPIMAEPRAQGFGGLVRQLRAEAGLTQEELAEAASLSPRSVSDLG